MIHNILEIKGTIFPAGRRTRVIVGPGAPAEAASFVMGHVTIFSGGEVPEHAHPQEEVYFIVQGEGVISLEGKDYPMPSGSYVHIPPNMVHHLRNTSGNDLVMMFCYAPKSIVEHWQQELTEKK